MIPRAEIIFWRAEHPWQQDSQVEQDLVLSRALVEMFRDDYLRKTLAFRGGTTIHKLFLTPAVRYSEDIDVVQVVAGPIGKTLDRIHAVLDPWLGEPQYVTTRMASNLFYHFESESNPGVTQKMKIEINTREHSAKYDLSAIPFKVDTRWFTGECRIASYCLEELLGTKLRALFQRDKGRDLFDLDYALREKAVVCQRVADAFVHYVSMQRRKITAKQFRKNLAEKQQDPTFGTDVLPLLRPGVEFNIHEAVGRIDSELIALLDGAWRGMHPRK
jgi:predicted nucleotidyltransferase component of viral defense system